MSGKILQINFKFDVSRADYERAVSPLAGEFAAVAGLRWKIWLMNEAESESAGIMNDSIHNGSIRKAVQNEQQ